jgi:hypothetical protein
MPGSPPKAICKRYLVEAEPARSGGGFVGIYGFPGKDRQEVRDEAGRVLFFEEEDSAIAAAGEALCAALNGRQRSSVQHGYRHIAGAELAHRLGKLGLGPADFARIIGSRPERIMEMIDMDEAKRRPVPHYANVLLAFLEQPGGLALATMLTMRHMTTERPPAPTRPDNP